MARGLKKVSRRWDDALSRIGWAEVERLLAVYYRGQGWVVEHCGTGSGGSRYDGGIDLKLRRDDEYVLVQSKHWNACQVPHNDIHQIIGVMVNQGATGAIVVTSGEFTKAAIEAANKLGHVQLIDGQALREMIGPLPEPDFARTPEPIADAAARHSPTRGTSRSPNRRRGHIGEPVRADARHPAQAILLELVIKGLGVLLIVLLFTWALQRVRSPLAVPPAPQTHAAPASVGATPTSKATLPAPTGTAQSAPTPQPLTDASRLSVMGPRTQRHSVPPGCVLIDHFSGTYACDPPPGAAPPRQPTAAEIRESQRKADEAIRVLEGRIEEI